MINTPVVFIIFNRSDTTEKVFQSIRAAKPAKLMVIADGPRKGKAGEAERCAAARAIVNGVDWPCEIQKNYSDVNLGCKRRVSSGLDWVFGEVEQAIILEDDCLPHPTFYRFCEEMLERYRDDERVWQIGANNFHFGEKRTEYSYYFSRYNQIWGWASWRRAWKYYDVEMKSWPQLRDGRWLYDMLEHEKIVAYWRKKFEKTYMGEIDTWDYQWTFTMWAHGGLSVLPNDNLVSNIGYGPEATHCIDVDKRAEVPVMPIAFPLVHPPLLSRDAAADSFIQTLLLPPPRHIRKYNMLKRKIKKIKKALFSIFGIVSV